MEEKSDSSPLTLADREVHAIIKEILLRTDLSILSEEGRDVPYQERKSWKAFCLIDPLDGTKEFIKRNGEFTVNISLVEEGKPVLGVVYAPAVGELYYASKFAEPRKATVREDGFLSAPTTLRPDVTVSGRDYTVIVASRSHMSEETKAFMKDLSRKGKVGIISKGSSLKLCLVAEGKADVYPRFGPTMEWDTAAGQAIVGFSGGKVVVLNGRPLSYNKKDLGNPHFLAVRKCYEL
ncbi:3'(2'),5'-bisphosphate nucleotidase CysQ [Thermovibrio sp.]